MVEFEWDEDKARVNLEKHGISFVEARSVFYDDYATQFFDEEHSDEEERFILLGLSNYSQVLVVIHCERNLGSTIRIISARRATKKERSYYEGPLS